MVKRVEEYVVIGNLENIFKTFFKCENYVRFWYGKRVIILP